MRVSPWLILCSLPITSLIEEVPLLLILWDESVIDAVLVAETRSEDCRRCDFMRLADNRQRLTTCMLSAMVSALIDRHPVSRISGSSA